MNAGQLLRRRRQEMRMVEITRISAYADGTCQIHLSHGEPVLVQSGWVAQHEPQPGGYLLIGRDGKLHFQAREQSYGVSAI
jgi:hypothetical protein